MIEYNVNRIESIEPTNKGFLINGEIAVGKAMSFGPHIDFPQTLLWVVEFHNPEFVEDPYSDEREETIGISSFNEEAHRLQQMLYKMGEW